MFIVIKSHKVQKLQCSESQPLLRESISTFLHILEIFSAFSSLCNTYLFLFLFTHMGLYYTYTILHLTIFIEQILYILYEEI